MPIKDIHCEHACRETCAMLKKALRLEEESLAFYRSLRSECDYPEVQSLLDDLLTNRRSATDRIAAQLSTMQARGEVLNDVMSSFDPAGC